MDRRVMPFAVAVTSMATVALELALTRIYSVTMYYHFAFLAISVALLGLATAGTMIYLLPRTFSRERTAKLASLFMIGFAITTIWWAGMGRAVYESREGVRGRQQSTRVGILAL